jgi:hypothetical protein
MKAVVDRFEGEWAVLIVEGQPLNVLRDALPENLREGDCLVMEIEDGQVVNAVIDEAETEAARQRIEEKMERLRRGEHLD